jgi:predicted alpha/beta-hydrolase family hydrolase
MTSQAHAEAALPNVAGLAFIGFPLHPAGKPSDDRARHLADVRIPMLFLQGTHDALADRKILTTTLARLSGVATSHLIEYADHSFHVPARSSTTDTQVLQEVLDTLAAWAWGVCQGKGLA